MKLSTRLFLGFSILLTVPASFYVAMDHLSREADRFRERTEFSNAEIRVINSITSRVNQQIFETVEVLIRERRTREEFRLRARAGVQQGFRDLKKAAAACVEARVPQGEEKAEVETLLLVEEIHQGYRKIDQGLEQALRLQAQGRSGEARALLSSVVENDYNRNFEENISRISAHEAMEIGEDVENLAASLRNLRVAVLALFGFSVVLTLTVAYLSAHHIRRKLSPLLKAIDRISQGDLDSRVPDLGNDEFGTLSKAFNSMIISLGSSSKMSALGEMASGVAHEINNPLAALSLRAEQLKEVANAGPLEPAFVVQAAGKIEAIALRIRKIVDSLRVFARDNSQDPFQLSSIQKIVDETLELSHDRLTRGRVRVEADVSFENLQLECQPVQLSQVLLNLISNAFDAIETLPEKWIRIEAKDIGEEIEFAVTDSGPGIPLEIREKIMEPFFTTKGVGKGTGLGLSISKGIIARHRGQFSIDTASANTRFIFRIPKKHVEDEILSPSRGVAA